MRVIVHSTDVQLFLLLRHILGSEGFAAHLVMSPDEAKALCGKEPVGLVIIDGSLPGVDVAGYCHAIKAISPLIAMAILSNRPVGPYRVPELSDLVDLVIAHPFDPAVLIGFLKTRCKIPPLKTGRSGETVLHYADIELDIASIKVRRRGRDVALTALQFRLLRYLLAHPTMVRSRDELIAAGWSEGADVEPRTVDIHIGHLRRALSRHGPDVIRTVRGEGYALDADAARQNQASPGPS
ncbi:hypothetical protein ATN84_06975 [Paramesorhizobium deserti]|uniref:OmpR/PhoB-type domain-containing protein n=1 Tax=Paramesorhizobium deserti TaxID=1494590 RepID=A0A135I1W6_9HYPH|nr:response regulator transcription factor [Paramesorhizobium deserti]KXF79432.1 hypothetical protein ATN84_06975 [Paramesorhizobium deserti]